MELRDTPSDQVAVSIGTHAQFIHIHIERYSIYGKQFENHLHLHPKMFGVGDHERNETQMNISPNDYSSHFGFRAR